MASIKINAKKARWGYNENSADGYEGRLGFFVTILRRISKKRQKN